MRITNNLQPQQIQQLTNTGMQPRGNRDVLSVVSITSAKVSQRHKTIEHIVSLAKRFKDAPISKLPRLVKDAITDKDMLAYIEKEYNRDGLESLYNDVSDALTASGFEHMYRDPGDPNIHFLMGLFIGIAVAIRVGFIRAIIG